MVTSNETPLYLQVEEALKDFQSGVTRLKSQQAETENLLAEGNQALENLVLQVARIEKLQEQVESDLRLLERLREKTVQEISALHQRVLTDASAHEVRTKKSIDNLRTDLSVRRQEALGLIRDLRQDLLSLERANAAAKAELEQDRASIKSLLDEMETGLLHCRGQLQDLANRLSSQDKRIRFLFGAIVILTLGTILSMLF